MHSDGLRLDLPSRERNLRERYTELLFGKCVGGDAGLEWQRLRLLHSDGLHLNLPSGERNLRERYAELLFGKCDGGDADLDW